MDCGLFHLMENFILKEIDYAQEYGYSSRAKRYMRRKLNQELAPYINDSDNSDNLDEDQEESIILPQHTKLNILLGVGYVFIVGVFYSTTMYIVYTYSKNCP